MADPLRLLFELGVDSRAGTAVLLRFRKDVAATIEAVRHAITQPLKSLNTAPITAAAKAAATAQEQEQRKLNAAVESLQRQRSAALVRALKEEERAVAASAKAQEQAVTAGLRAQARVAQVAAKAQQQAARQAVTQLARTPQSDQQVRDFSRIEAERQKAARAAEATATKSARAQERAAQQSSRAQEREQRRLNSAVQSLQRQRSAALIRAFRDEERAAVASARAQERAARQAAQSISQAFRGIGPGLQSLGRTLTIGVTAPLLALGAASLKSAKDLDANVNTLKAFTGSAEAAERRLAELIKTARGTPGLTTNLALTLDAQLRVAQTTEETINRVLPAIGRLNAVSKLPDAARFTQNLLQLVTQNFERQDLKELVGQSPLAGQLITEVFNVDSPVNAKAIREQAKKLGLTTVDAFFNAFAAAAARNQGLATVTESIGTRFDKIVDRVTVALRPLGLAILNAIQPFVDPVARLIERLGKTFDSLSEPVKTAIIVIAGIAAAVGPVLFVLGSLVNGITAVTSVIATVGAIVAAIGLPEITLVIAGLLVVIGEWIVILGALGLAWKKNFLGIRDLVSNASTAVLDAFSRIRAVIDEATQRILPTLQSVTEKVLGVVTALWERFGPTVVSIVSTSFTIVARIIETTLRFLGNLADLALKIIDSDWRGAWRAFSRIVINALDSITEFFEKALPTLRRGFLTLNAFLIRQAVTFAQTASALAARFITSLVVAFIAGAPQISDALAKMLLLAAAGVVVGPIGTALVAGLLASMRKAASEAPPIPIKVEAQNVGADVGFTGGIARKKRPPQEADEKADKGADAATRRRIRLLELEAEKVRTLTDAQLAREQIAFDERKKSLEDWTNTQIEAAGNVLIAQLAVYKKEREEARKIRNQSARDLTLAEIGQKEFEAQQAFSTKVAQLEAVRRKEELDAAKAHRQALLDIQEEGDKRQLARLEELSRTGSITAFELERQRAEIEAEARRRRRTELETQLKEAGENKEERKRIQDDLDQFNQESASATEEAERRKREAIQTTVKAYNDYRSAIREALAATGAAVREIVRLALDRPEAAFNLGRQRLIKAQFKLRQQELESDRKFAQQRIDEEEQDAIERAKLTGDFERRRAEIEKTFRDRRRSEEQRFRAERRALEEEEQRELERANPNSTRSLFGDTFADATSAIRDFAEQAGQAISNLQVILGGFGAAAAEHFANASAQAGNFISILLDGIDQINLGLADMLGDWILLGETGSAAFRKLIASTLAYYAKTFLIKALDNIGEAFSNLAKASAAAASGNFFSAALYKAAALHNFASAAKYGIASAAMAVAGHFAAGDSFKQKDTASRAITGGEPSPRNTTFNLGGQGPIETSLRAAQEGSGGGLVGQLVARVEQFQQQNLEVQRQQQLHNAQVAEVLTRMKTARAGDVVTMGASDARQAIGVAVIDHSNASGDFNETLQRNLGFA